MPDPQDAELARADEHDVTGVAPCGRAWWLLSTVLSNPEAETTHCPAATQARPRVTRNQEKTDENAAALLMPDFRLSVSRNVRKLICAVLSHSVCVHYVTAALERNTLAKVAPDSQLQTASQTSVYDLITKRIPF